MKSEPAVWTVTLLAALALTIIKDKPGFEAAEGNVHVMSVAPSKRQRKFELEIV